METQTHETFKTKQQAHVGKFSLMTSGGKLLAPIARTDRPRLYDTMEAAIEAASSIQSSLKLTPVELV